jgi:uncharacterized small protein (DUF1192 family)
MSATFDDIAKDYMLSFVDNSEYSANEHMNGSMFIRNLFANIKGSLINDDEDLQSLSVKFLADHIGLNSSELKRLERKLKGSE